MWKLLLLIPITIGLLLGLLTGFIAILDFQTPIYTYAGENYVSLQQYNDIDNYSDSSRTLKISDISDNKLKIIYSFKSSRQFSYLVLIKSETQFWFPLFILFLSLAMIATVVYAIVSLIKSFLPKKGL